MVLQVQVHFGKGNIFTKGGLKNIASRIGLGKFKNIGGERIFEANKLGSFLSNLVQLLVHQL